MLQVVRQGGRGSSTLITYASVLAVVDFILAGGILPLLPCEQKLRAKPQAGKRSRVKPKKK